MTTMNSRYPMHTTTRIQWTLSALALASLLACGGGGTTTPTPTPPKTVADRLDYANPPSGSFMLVKDSSSTATHLVLNLMGPAQTVQGTGVGFYLSADAGKVTWSKPTGAEPILARNGVFDLGAAPQLAAAKASGDQIQVAFYQKGTTKAALTLGPTTVLATVALDLKPNVPLGAVTFSAVAGKAVLTNGIAAPTPITLSAGAITAN